MRKTKKGMKLTMATLVLAMTACSVGEQPAQEDEGIHYTAGTYTATADGRGGEMTVEVTVSEDEIISIEVTDHQETPGISDYPLTEIPAEIVEYQSLNVDSVTGATMTSSAIVRAVSDALEQAGADVILVEKLPFAGGSLLLAGGGFATAESDVVSAMGADDSLERIMDYFRMVNEASQRQPDYEFVEYVLSETGNTIDYMTNKFGMEPTYSDRGDYIRTNFGEGWQEVASLLQVLEDEGATVLLNTEATGIVMKDGAAAGLEVSGENGDFTIHADKVIIATGGASWDQERLQAANPELETVALNEQAIRGNSGDGLGMLEEVGAQMGEGPFIKSAYPDFSVAFRFTWRNNPSVANSLVVDAEGNRFYNEAPYNSMMLNQHMIEHESPAYYALFDTVNTDENFLALLEEYAADDNANIVVYGQTIEEVAEKLDMDSATLQATYDRYQQMCINGVDEDFGKSALNLIAYQPEGGFYAAYIQPASWGTIGGAITDEQFHVLDTENQPIANLYAVGESATSTLFGDYYLGGFSLGYYSTAGRIAAQSAVSELGIAE